MTTLTTSDDLLATVRSIETTLAAHAPEAERERRLAAAAAGAMREAGLYRLWRPRALGGHELDPVSAFRVIEDVSRIDSAAGWNLQISCAFDLLGRWFSEPVAREIFGDPDATFAVADFPARKAVAADGGYRVTGQTSFNSGVHHAKWVSGLAVVHDGDEPRTNERGEPVEIMTLCPAHEVEIIDNWSTMGMRGTGSHDVRMTDVFIPEVHAPVWTPLAPAGPAYQGPLYRIALWVAIAALAPPALGIAQAAIDGAVALTKKKIPAYLTSKLDERPVVYRQLALAEASLASGRAYLHEVFGGLYAEAGAGRGMTMEDKGRAQLAATNAIQSAARAVRCIHEVVGASGIREAYAFERHFRDIHVITQHGFTNMAKLESVGQIMLGLEPEWPFFAF